MRQRFVSGVRLCSFFSMGVAVAHLRGRVAVVVAGALVRWLAGSSSVA